MLWGVLADIHSNLEALEAALLLLEEKGAEGYICCGDIVGYGADVNRVVERVRQLPEFVCVRGNHDLAVLGRMSLDWFNAAARAAAEYAQRTLTDENLAWLKELGPRVDHEGFTVVHGSPRNPAEEYLVTQQQFQDNCTYFDISPCFVGHSHLPLCIMMREPMSMIEMGSLADGQQVPAPLGQRTVVNPGSVGQPRDHDPRASCGMYDDLRRCFTVYRVEYDVETVQRKILAAGLPEFLALRLAYGQ
jgi:diadenosine tetraphosphatase ApaH/serine/threonine PP2A family protein phosphatase